MDDDTYELSFRIQNNNYSLSLAAFGNYFGFGRSLIWKAPDDFDAYVLWDCISEVPIHKLSNVRVNNIHHPAIRLWFRTVIGTIFGRGEVGTLNFTELSMLGSFLNVQRGDRFALDIPYLVVKHMLDVAECRIRSIEIGGIITFLLKSMGFDLGDLAPYITQDRWIDVEYLRQQHRWVHMDRGVFRWRVSTDPDRYITLPSDQLPALYTLRAGVGEGLPSYLIPVETISHVRVERERTRRPRRQAQEEPSSSRQTPSHDEISMNQFRFNNRRTAHIAANQSLEGYWTYHGQVEAGIAQAPHPTYYRGADTSGIFEEAGIDQSQWGPNYHRSYGGLGGQFLDEFARINLGGDGNDDGNDEDDEED